MSEVKVQILKIEEKSYLKQAAHHLMNEFDNEDWETLEGATKEINEILEEGFIFVALQDATILGWVGALPNYDHAWELHPLVVGEAYQRQGIGSKLITALENHLREMKVSVVFLGSDDADETSLSLIDNLFEDLYTHIAQIYSLNPAEPHPFEFYRKHGYKIVGVIPDANGKGKSDILMAKRLL
jgi:aminoglycoside 6'-N-acetyltransferase I